MKLQKLKQQNFQSQFLIAKTTFLKKKSCNTLDQLKSTKTLLYNITNIIFEYDAKGKKILFLEFLERPSKILHNKRHFQLPDLILYNQSKQYKTATSRLVLKNQVDLIITFEQVKTNENVPVISIKKKLQSMKAENLKMYNIIIERTENLEFFSSLIKGIVNKVRHVKT